LYRLDLDGLCFSSSNHIKIDRFASNRRIVACFVNSGKLKYRHAKELIIVSIIIMDSMLICIAVVLFITYLGFGVTQAQVQKQERELLAYRE